MADFSTLARPYAKAAFDYANEHQVINEWEYFLFIASYIVNDPSFNELLDNPAIDAEQKSAALVGIYDTDVAMADDSALKKLLSHTQGHQGETLSQAVYPKTSNALKNFVTQLAQQERLALLPQIYEHFRHHKTHALKQVDAYVTSAYPLTQAQRTLFQVRLTATLNANVVLHEAVDPSLLAGATIKIGDKIVDDSIRGKLKQLKTQLTA